MSHVAVLGIYEAYVMAESIITAKLDGDSRFLVAGHHAFENPTFW